MDIRFDVKDAGTLARLRGLSVEAFMEAWAEAVRGLARRNAIDRIGGRFGRDTVANSVRQDTMATVATVYSMGKIGEHVHKGGPIESPSGKKLAIPTRWNPRRDLFASSWTRELVLLRSKKSGRAYLFEKPEEGQRMLGRPMFYVTPRTRPQKPRPWWPTEAEVETATRKFFAENFDGTQTC